MSSHAHPPNRPSPSGKPPGPGAIHSEYANDPDMAELVSYFVGELQQRIDRLNRAWQNSSHEELRLLAHQIKGAAGGYGFPMLTKSAAQLEEALMAEETEVASLKEKVEALIALCRRAAAGS